jgi:hypothetical protein
MYSPPPLPTLLVLTSYPARCTHLLPTSTHHPACPSPPLTSYPAHHHPPVITSTRPSPLQPAYHHHSPLPCTLLLLLTHHPPLLCTLLILLTHHPSHYPPSLPVPVGACLPHSCLPSCLCLPVPACYAATMRCYAIAMHAEQLCLGYACACRCLLFPPTEKVYRCPTVLKRQSPITAIQLRLAHAASAAPAAALMPVTYCCFSARHRCPSPLPPNPPNLKTPPS